MSDDIFGLIGALLSGYTHQMKRFVLFCLAMLMLVIAVSPVSNASTVVKDGVRCTKLNQKVTYSKKIFQCKKSKSKLVWRFVANVPAPVTKCTKPSEFASDAKYLWSQEFKEASGHCPATAAWTSLIGNGSQLGLYKYGTGELELNTATAAVTDGSGHLVINTIKRNNVWTSSRIWTQGKFNFQYGKIEARMKLPTGDFNWPALWMLGSNYMPPDSSGGDPSWVFGDTPWPNSGEIDIVEGMRDNSIAQATLHGNNPNTNNSWNGLQGIPLKAPLANISSAFHTFGMLWKPNVIIYTLDGVEYGRNSFDGTTITQTVKGKVTSTLNTGGVWPFNKPFFLIVNNAVSPGASNMLPNGTSSKLLVDWIHYSTYDGYGVVNP